MADSSGAEGLLALNTTGEHWAELGGDIHWNMVLIFKQFLQALSFFDGFKKRVSKWHPVLAKLGLVFYLSLMDCRV